MDEKLVSGLLERLDTLTAKLGVGADALWAVFVRQAVISSWIDIGVCVLIAAAWPALWKLTRAAKNIPVDRDGDDQLRALGLIGCGLLAFGLVLTTAIAVTSLSSILTGIVNPEYWAFQKLVGHKS